MREKLDMHIHSRFDDGAKNMTVTEIVRTAAGKSLTGIGIVLHYQQSFLDDENRPGTIGIYPSQFPAKYEQLIEDARTVSMPPDLEVKVGIETEIRDVAGNLNAPREIIDKASIVLASCHWLPNEILPYDLTSGFFTDKEKAVQYFGSEEWRKIIERIGRENIIEKYFQMFEAAITKNPGIILAHPALTDLGVYQVIESLTEVRGRLVRLADVIAETGTAFNLCAGTPRLIEKPSIDDCGISPDYWHSVTEWIEICKEREILFLPGSDAHSLEEVGNVEGCYRMLSGMTR